MEEKDRIKSLHNQAKVYRSHGLLEQSRQNYVEMLALIESSGEQSNYESLIHSVKKIIHALDKELAEMDKTPDESPELPGEIQDLIRNLFSFSENTDTAAMEGAVALAKFGQYEKALEAFQRLMDEGILPLSAAKNILRCQLTFFSPDTAINQFKNWLSRPIFKSDELNDLKIFLEKMLEKEGIKADLSIPSDISFERGQGNGNGSEQFLEITSIRACLDSGPLKGKEVDLDITFQVGNTVSFIVNAEERHLVDAFMPGINLPNVHCFSSESIFNTRGRILERRMITSGPKQGDYSFDLSIEGPAS